MQLSKENFSNNLHPRQQINTTLQRIDLPFSSALIFLVSLYKCHFLQLTG